MMVLLGGETHGPFESIEIARGAKPATDGRFDLGVCRLPSVDGRVVA